MDQLIYRDMNVERNCFIIAIHEFKQAKISFLHIVVFYKLLPSTTATWIFFFVTDRNGPCTPLKMKDSIFVLLRKLLECKFNRYGLVINKNKTY
jgi:hypothetical protein